MSKLAKSIAKITCARYRSLTTSQRFQFVRNVYRSAQAGELPAERPLSRAQYDTLLQSNVVGTTVVPTMSEEKESSVFGRKVDWREIIKEPGVWHPGLDYSALFAGTSLLVLGDTNHGYLSLQRGLVDSLPALKAAGVTHLCLECPSDYEPRDNIENAQKGWIPHRGLQLMMSAQKLGIQVVFIDMPEAEYDAGWKEDEQSFQRGVYMGQFLAAFQRTNPDARIAAITGYAHIMDWEQIPGQLLDQGIDFRLAAMVAEGQPDYLLGQEANMYKLPVVDAVAGHAARGERAGWLDLSRRSFDVQAIIHFPTAQMEARQAKALPKELPALPAGEMSSQVVSLTRLDHTQITRPLELDFSDRVHRNVNYWPKTNEQKIIEFVMGMEELSQGQKLYLTALLLIYARNTGEHSLGGSIVNMGFVPEGRFFEFKTVDTCGYAYESADWSRFERHYEVSVRTLEERSGLGDLLLDRDEEIPAIMIRPAEPQALPRFLIFLLAAMRAPERIWGPYVYDRDVSKTTKGAVTLAELQLHEFALSALEKEFIATGNLFFKLDDPFSSLAHRWLKDPAIHLPKRPMFWKVIGKLGDYFASIDPESWEKFYFLPERRILEARKELRYLNETEKRELLGKLHDAIEDFSGLLEELSKYYESINYRASSLYYRILGKEPDMRSHKGRPSEHMSAARTLLSQLQEAHKRIEAMPAENEAARAVGLLEEKIA